MAEFYGPGREPERKHGGYGEFKSAAWQRVRLWETAEVQIKLYILHGHSEPPSLGLLARHRHLVDVIAREEDRQYWWKWGPWTAYWGNPADRELARELDGELPGLKQMLLEEPKGTNTVTPPEEIHRFLTLLLVKARKSSSEHRPALLLAANRLAGRFNPASDAESVIGRVQKKIGGYELNYLWNHLGSGWAYQEDLSWLLWKEYGTSVWGEMAFVMLLSRGWNTTVGCGSRGIGDDFRHVIMEAEKFLADRPQSPFRRDVSLMLAQAYETWWSLSRASVQDSYANRFAYFDGAEEARKKAITLYEVVAQSDPSGYEAKYARQRLPRLKTGLDTNQRRFFCIYD